MLLEFLYDALRSPRGVIVETPDGVERLRQKLYALRKQTADPALDVLAFIPSPIAPETELWIVKARTDGPDDRE